MGAERYEGSGVGVSVTSCDLTDIIRTLIVCELLAYKVGMRIYIYPINRIMQFYDPPKTCKNC